MLDIKELDKKDYSDLVNDFGLPDGIIGSDICDYYIVFDSDNNERLAVFDVRKAPDSIKQMSIFYSKKAFNLEESGRGVLEKSMAAFNVVVKIFKYVVDNDYDVKTTKIYSANNYEYAVFSIMAKNLMEQGGYSVKLYTKWIEIIKEA